MTEESQVAVDNHFADVMADYYAKKAQVAAAAEKGETVTFGLFKPVKLRKNLKKFRLQKLKQNKKNTIVPLRRRVQVLLLA